MQVTIEMDAQNLPKTESFEKVRVLETSFYKQLIFLPMNQMLCFASAIMDTHQASQTQAHSANIIRKVVVE